ncbi:hypothetical protein [Actinoplanes sp. L3-i22]|uniref:hypothetical protein n=1 Tax=Actinoplanes sp. L3-i22 TaxID=2836373 RepID=UPI001C754F8F|nr:hypothetical protein [Actinoplanes sp. L3-i22]BCY13969.1 hypothetical protein L3i22_090570 [Actinoplanes sp. L3-i22]
MRAARKAGILGSVAALVSTFLVASPAYAADLDWETAVKKIPAAKYTRDAPTYVRDATTRVAPYFDSEDTREKLQPVVDDLDTRYFDGARLKTATDAKKAFGNLGELLDELEDDADEKQPYLDALVSSLTGVRLLADASVQDAQAIVGPWTVISPAPPAPAGLADAQADLTKAKKALKNADEQLGEADPEDATEYAAESWKNGFAVLGRFGITYEGDHDADGVVDVTELRFGSSPLVADSDGDGLTDLTEIEQLATFTRPNNPDSDGDGVTDGAEDADGDGLTNLREQELGTKLTDPDTDGDGLADGAEVAQGRNPLVADNPPPPVSEPTSPVPTTPTDTDTDGDGILDGTEVDDTGTDPANPDSDGDGLSDLVEISDYYTDPLSADTDGDAIADAYEVAHAEDQGLDPTVADERVSKWTYVSDFVVGLIAGDFKPKDSMAWLSGYLCSGGLSLIPVVGWVLGGLADLRDTIAGLINQDWVGAGLSVMGLVPYVGDAVAIPGKAAKFVAKYLHRLDKVATFVAKYSKISDSVKILTLKTIMVGRYGRFTDAGFADNIILRMAANGKNSLNRLADALTSAVTPPPAAIPWIRGWKAGEKYVIEEILGNVPGKIGKDARFETGGVPFPNAAREPDFLETGPPLKLHEVKTGRPHPSKDNKTGYLKQCEQDRWALDNGKVDDVLWHFLPGADGTLDIPQDLLDCLRTKRIPFKIYPSNGSFYP